MSGSLPSAMSQPERGTSHGRLALTSRIHASPRRQHPGVISRGARPKLEREPRPGPGSAQVPITVGASSWARGRGVPPRALRRRPVDVLGTLLHEDAHGLAQARQVNDTSRQGRFDSRRYKAVAENSACKSTTTCTIGWSTPAFPGDRRGLPRRTRTPGSCPGRLAPPRDGASGLAGRLTNASTATMCTHLSQVGFQ